MIVVDSNVVAYCWLNGPLTAMAQQVFARDPHWHVPVLWRSEMRSILTGACRAGLLEWDQAMRVLTAAENTLERREHLPSSADVLRVCLASGLSAYDAEFVALARQLGALLVTEDRAILRFFPDLALTMSRFVERGTGLN